MQFYSIFENVNFPGFQADQLQAHSKMLRKIGHNQDFVQTDMYHDGRFFTKNTGKIQVCDFAVFLWFSELSERYWPVFRTAQ